MNALLSSRLGKAIARPSTFSPEPAIKFFALSGLTNEQDAYIISPNPTTETARMTMLNAITDRSLQVKETDA